MTPNPTPTLAQGPVHSWIMSSCEPIRIPSRWRVWHYGLQPPRPKGPSRLRTSIASIRPCSRPSGRGRMQSSAKLSGRHGDISFGFMRSSSRPDGIGEATNAHRRGPPYGYGTGGGGPDLRDPRHPGRPASHSCSKGWLPLSQISFRVCKGPADLRPIGLSHPVGKALLRAL